MRKLLLGLFFGLLSQAALAQAPSSLPGCQYNATPPTLSDKQTTVWQCDINGKLITSGGGNVVGPASSTDNALARWDGTTGQLLQDSTVIVGDAATGTIRFGAALDAAAPVAQMLSVQSVIAGTANTAGAAFTIAGSKSTGSAAGGSIIFQTAAAGGAGSSQNALATALTIASDKSVTFTGAISGQTISAATGINNYNNLNFRDGGASTLRFGSGNLIAWSDNVDGAAGTLDTKIYRDAANTLALRNSTTAQTFNVYNTWTDASNYERGQIRWSGNQLQIGSTKAGTGTGRVVVVGSNLDGNADNNLVLQGTVIRFYVATGIEPWNIGSTGHLIAPTDNTYDIGALGATRPRNVYVGTGITSLAVTSTQYVFTSGSVLQDISNGVARFTDGGGTTALIQIGGSTSASPALKKNGIKLEAKLADDSTYASFAARGLIVAGAVPTLALAGGTCAGTVIAGGSTAGTVTLTGVCVATNTMALTVMPTAPTGYACDAIDRTLGSSLLTETATTTTSVTFTFGGTTGATDVLAYKCIAY